MSAIFQINQNDIPWSEFGDSTAGNERAPIRYKALTMDAPKAPPVQYVEYAPGHADPVHSHKAGEILVVTDGELWLDGVKSAAGSIVFVPRDTDYSVRGGAEGVRFFRVVVA